MKKILLITPPFLQPNSPYPANPYLSGYLERKGIETTQFDLSIELTNAIFSRPWLEKMFANYTGSEDENLERIFCLRGKYLSSIDAVMDFLRGQDTTLANLICTSDFVPQASRFEDTIDMEVAFGQMGIVDCAKYICTLYLQDLSDFIRGTVSEHFEIVKYAEKISVSLPDFSTLEVELSKEHNMVELTMVEMVDSKINQVCPDFVSFTIPFPGNLLSSLRCAQYLKAQYPHIKTIAGGGYPSTELRQMSDKAIFNYFDYISLDDGELPLERIVTGGELIQTYTKEGFYDAKQTVSHTERGCPNYSTLSHNKYFSLLEVANPMHRLWSDGRWNKMTIAHGCYWGRCAFCDTSLDYIKCYDTVNSSLFVDWMVRVASETGSHGFHFTDEAAPPKLLREISLEIIRRGLGFSWWTNIRFESAYTGDLCRLMAAAGCIAVAGGLEVASDRLLKVIDKGVTIEQATIAMRNFYYGGIMVHAYLMYGLPTQTLQESVDSLEVVRQMFQAELISSGFWHRYAMTLHSPSGIDPEKFGVKLKKSTLNSFANNETYFTENRGYNINIVGDALHESLANYMAGEGVELAAHKWFAGKSTPTTIEPSLVTDHLIKPDSSRIFNPNSHLVWIGTPLLRSEEGVIINAPSDQKELKFKAEDTDFLVHITEMCSDLGQRVSFGEVRDIYSKYSIEPFSTLYHSKKWDKMREYGLLQL